MRHVLAGLTLALAAAMPPVVASDAPMQPPVSAAAMQLVPMHDAVERARDASAFLSSRSIDAASIPRHLVTSLADGGAGSLREAIDAANAAPGMAVIEFQSTLAGTIQFNNGPLEIQDSVILLGPGARYLTLDGGRLNRVLSIRAMDGRALDVLLLGLTVSGGYSTLGAGISSVGANLTLGDCVLTDNHTRNSIAAEIGGGLYQRGGSLHIDRCVFRNNSAGTYGGGIAVKDASVSIQDSSISSNLAGSGAGLHVDTAAPFVLRRTLVAFNEASQSGGGLALNTPSYPALIENSTFSGNSAYDEPASGAGIAASGKVKIAFSTIADNRLNRRLADGAGAGVHFDDATGLLRLEAALLAGNKALDGDVDLGRASGTIDAIVSLVDTQTTNALNGYGLGNLLGVDPKLAPLADNGGPTPTHAIAADSPARDVGTGAGYSPVNTDQRGYERRWPEPVDIGAYEYGADRLLTDGFDG
ncbi:MAG: right-handed parallel beta-helix repeat-containing protein [Rhodanobacteraceae bacterium]|jgi:predicted outer membrane repeat protein|nr:right-handed parallel beta-helix repeat-containing protein [Rhodanobacteraceae bacterium]